MQPPSFWVKFMMRSHADDCVWHAIVPTTMMHVMGTSEHMVSISAPEDKELVLANMYCACCARSVESQPCLFAIRVIVCAKPGARPCVGFNSTTICLHCSDTFPTFPCDAYMRDHVINRLEDIRNRCYIPYFKGPAYWSAVVAVFNREHAMTMKTFGKSSGKCGYCGAAKPKHRCSACNHTHYCGEACARANWPQHKPMCAIMQKSIFCDDAEIKSLLPTGS
jgi:hypothetical protein